MLQPDGPIAVGRVHSSMGIAKDDPVSFIPFDQALTMVVRAGRIEWPRGRMPTPPDHSPLLQDPALWAAISVGHECHLLIPGWSESQRYADGTDFLLDKLNRLE